MNEILDKDEVTALWWLLTNCVDKPEAVSNILSSPDESQEQREERMQRIISVAVKFHHLVIVEPPVSGTRLSISRVN